jgi:hypothetical protein
MKITFPIICRSRYYCYTDSYKDLLVGFDITTVNKSQR